MAIRSIHGDRATPKEKAQELMLIAMTNAMYHLNDVDGLTEREQAQIEDQMVKQLRRVEKLFGYEPGSWRFG